MRFIEDVEEAAAGKALEACETVKVEIDGPLRGRPKEKMLFSPLRQPDGPIPCDGPELTVREAGVQQGEDGATAVVDEVPEAGEGCLYLDLGVDDVNKLCLLTGMPETAVTVDNGDLFEVF